MKKLISAIFAAVLICMSVVPVFAEVSPTATIRYIVITDVDPCGAGIANHRFVTGIDENGHQTVIIAQTPNPGWKFTYWQIIGDYTTTDELTDDRLTLVISSDITAIAHYVRDSECATKECTPEKCNECTASPDTACKSSACNTSTPVTKDTSSVSPKTGSSDLIFDTFTISGDCKRFLL